MNQSQMKPLNLNEGFESIVNAGTAKYRKATAKRILKKLRIAVILLAMILINIILWMFGVTPSVPSVIVTEILSCVASFIVGQLWEVNNR